MDRKEYNRRWYLRHRDEQIARAKANKAKYKAAARALIDAAKDQPCADCGYSYPVYVMDLDHVRGRKKFNVSEANGSNRWPSMKELKAEIAKCEAVCANCHRERTYNPSSSVD